MISFATTIVTNRDLTGDLARFTPDQIGTQIEDAVTELYEHIPNLDALLAAGTVSEASVEKLVAKAVIGATRNVEGLKSESDGGYSYQRFGDGFVWFRKSDIDRLLRRSSRTKVQTIMIRAGGCA